MHKSVKNYKRKLNHVQMVSYLTYKKSLHIREVPAVLIRQASRLMKKCRAGTSIFFRGANNLNNVPIENVCLALKTQRSSISGELFCLHWRIATHYLFSFWYF